MLDPVHWSQLRLIRPSESAARWVQIPLEQAHQI